MAFRVRLPTPTIAARIAEACDVDLGYPREPSHRGRRVPSGLGRTERYAAVAGADLVVDEEWERRLRGRQVRVRGVPVAIPDVAAEVFEPDAADGS